ncbi:MAG: hypothetical protein KatS3mg090_1024 [Patescibacteria group bacterium]|nr:MAG: hypothetical protein KatS3mg090_1024 [Patescibacteria group bacterium]
MRYPVDKNKSDFQKNWYVASGFGEFRNTYYHNGVDLNLKSGGDTDMGQPLYAVADGVIKYYHKSKHPNTGYGLHMVLEVDTPKGKRWFHYAHCLEITDQAKQVKEGEIIGKVGKSGTKYAHLHFSCFKVDPATLPNGIDTIAKTKQQLNSWWEDPLQVIEELMANQGSYYRGIDLTNIESIKVCIDTWKDVVDGKYVKFEDYEKIKKERDEAINIIINKEKAISNLEDEKKTIEKSIESFNKKIVELNNQISELEKKIDDGSKEIIKKDREIANLEKQLEIKENQLQADKEKAKIECEKKLKDQEIRLVKDFETREKQLKEQIAKLQEDLKKKEVVVQKEFEVPKDFKRRFVLALEVLLGAYEK